MTWLWRRVRARRSSWVDGMILGVLLTLQAAMLLSFGTTSKPEPSLLPGDLVETLGVEIPIDRYILTGIVIVLAYVVMMVKANLDEFPVVPAGMAPRPPGTIPPPPGYAPFPPAPGTIPPPPAPTQRPMY